MSDRNKGPIFGVPLPAHLDLPGGRQQLVPAAKELERLIDSVSLYKPIAAKTIQSLEVALALVAAIDRGGYDVSPCLICQELVVCIPGGIPMCLKCVEKCAEKAGG